MLKKLKFEHLAIFSLLVFAGAIRLLTLAKLSVFTPDEEYLLYLAQTIVKDFHVIWIGVSALGFDFYMGPYWIYAITPFVAIAKGDPFILGVMTSLIGVGTIYLIYLAGKIIFNKKIGFIAACIYAFSSLIIYYDQQPYPPMVPILSLLLVFSLYLTKYSKYWWIAFAALYGLVFHIHLSLFLLAGVGFYWLVSHRERIDLKTFFLSCGAFLLMIFPLIVFDYYHNASNITVPLRLINAQSGIRRNTDLSKRFTNFYQAVGRVWYLAPFKNNADEILYPCIIDPISTTTKAVPVLSLLSIGILLIFIVKKNTWRDEGRRLILIASLAFVIPFLFLPVINPIEYYLLGFFPLLFLISASVIADIKKPFSICAYVILVIFISYNVFVVLTAKGDFGLQTKKTLIQKVMQVVKDDPFIISEVGSCNRSGGWRYLFVVYAHKPERSLDEDKAFSWLYPGEVTQVPEKYEVVFKETRSPNQVRPGYKYSLEEGGFTAYIYE